MENWMQYHSWATNHKLEPNMCFSLLILQTFTVFDYYE